MVPTDRARHVAATARLWVQWKSVTFKLTRTPATELHKPMLCVTVIRSKSVSCLNIGVRGFGTAPIRLKALPVCA